MSRWPQTIEKYRSANYLSTGFGESSHALLKEAAKYINSLGKAAVDAQVCLDMHPDVDMLTLNFFAHDANYNSHNLVTL